MSKFKGLAGRAGLIITFIAVTFTALGDPLPWVYLPITLVCMTAWLWWGAK